MTPALADLSARAGVAYTDRCPSCQGKGKQPRSRVISLARRVHNEAMIAKEKITCRTCKGTGKVDDE